MDDTEKIPDVLIGRLDKYYSDKSIPWGKYVFGREYTCGVVLDGKVIYSQGRSSVLDSLKDSANDAYGRISWHKCSKYNLKNGFRIDEDGKIVACEQVSSEEEAIFKETIDSRLNIIS